MKKIVIRVLISLAIAFMFVNLAFFAGAKWANDANTEYLNSQHVFCKKCCWQTEHLYTCAETEQELWRRVP